MAGTGTNSFYQLRLRNFKAGEQFSILVALALIHLDLLISTDIGLIIVITLDEDKSKQIISGKFQQPVVASGGNNGIIMFAEGCIYSHRNWLI